MNNIRTEALKELNEVFPDVTYTCYVLIFKDSDLSYHWVVVSQHRLEAVEQLLHQQFPSAVIEEIGYFWPLDKDNQGAQRIGYVNEWKQYKFAGTDPRQTSIFKLVMDERQPT